MMKLMIIALSLLFYIFFNVQSQLILKAIVLDKQGIPIPYANINNIGTHSGVITNAEGRFIMDCNPNDTIIISCLGYQETKRKAIQLQKDSIVSMIDEIYTIGEVKISLSNAEDIVKKVHARIRQNYPKKPAIINGVLKEYSAIDDEYYGFLQCDVDILINSLSSFSPPKFETKVYDYKSFRHLNRENVEHISTLSYFRYFWLYNYSYFLWNSKEYQYRLLGNTIYKESELLKIQFSPKQIVNHVHQVKGTMYIEKNSYALVFLQFEMLPNQMDYYSYKGRWQKPTKGETKIMFEFRDQYYYPTYVVSKQTSIGIVSDWKFKPANNDTVNIDFVYNFFTKDIVYKPKSFVTDSLSLDKLNFKLKSEIFDQSTDYKSDFILETEDEKKLKENYCD